MSLILLRATCSRELEDKMAVAASGSLYVSGTAPSINLPFRLCPIASFIFRKVTDYRFSYVCTFSEDLERSLRERVTQKGGSVGNTGRFQP